MSMNFLRKLQIPKDIKELYPLTEEMKVVREQRINELTDIFSGKSDKLALIIGPCSADNSEAVLDYISRLKLLEEEVKDKIFIVPRIYTNKPRTTGDGYKGMLHQPNPEENPDMLKGIIAIRDLHLSALRDYGYACADEMLYPENYRYLSDLLAYVAVGARSVENQQHRLTASGIEVPVGMKNPTSGDLSIMMNSITAAQHKHTFIYRGWEVKSDGNPFAHAILRGSIDFAGKNVSNYHYEDLVKLYNLYGETNLLNPSVVVDTNHANSGKQYLEQTRIATDVIHSCNHNDDIKKMVKGLMIESYIEDGAQKIGEHIYGKSITDPCLGFEKTRDLVLRVADMRK
ncbi:MAG: 3-deoxy-7-phosphoheptulonate synthase [Clostridia bacterium]|nr:3-deoxy-7-phosphoheptulonate synthase [Clostridia bacterium]